MKEGERMTADEASLAGIEARIAAARRAGETGACIKIGCDLAEAIVREIRLARAAKK